MDECGHALHVDKVRDNPDMRLVELCDTDLMTYARIQVDIAYADRNEQLLNHWWAQSCKPKPPRLLGETDDEWVLRYARFRSEEYEEEKRREAKAMENARTRVAAGKRAKIGPNVAISVNE